MKKHNLLAKKVEAILFLESRYVQKTELTKTLSCSKEALEQALNILNSNYSNNGHVFLIEEHKDSVILMIQRKEIEDVIIPYEDVKKETLSKTVLETLAIIAYSQPITKSEINSIRGVNSSNAIALLLEKHIISVAGKRAVPGNPNEYITTPKFLKIFKLSSITELPSLEEKDKVLFLQNNNEA